MGTFSSTGTADVQINRDSVSTRRIECFEVLDYDSIANAVCLIYKKVTISPNQRREYDFSVTYDSPYLKALQCPGPLPIEINDYPAVDRYDYDGTRKVEYKLCLLVGSVKQTYDLGTVTIGVSGSYTINGSYKELVEGGSDPIYFYQTFKTTITGPSFSVSGNRLYGVNVNCGKNAVTYTYDVEDQQGPLVFGHDSPINIEDYNEFWKKIKRVVGVMNYSGKRDSKEFNYGESGTSGFPDSVMSICYRKP